jgi:hypothetical protein
MTHDFLSTEGASRGMNYLALLGTTIMNGILEYMLIMMERKSGMAVSSSP